MKIYCMGGLGADQRVFENFQPDHPCTFLPWLPPHSDETLPAYARRFSKQIATDQPFALLGVSFGGMLALELNQWVQPALTVLISSAASPREFPWAFRILAKSRHTRTIPSFLLRPPAVALAYAFGIKEKKHKTMLKDIIHDTDPSFFRWALRSLLQWHPSPLPPTAYRIHGTRDKIIPYSPRHNQHAIDGAGHFMIMTHAGAVSRIVHDLISQVPDHTSPAR